jgi:hypothetical protein
MMQIVECSFTADEYLELEINSEERPIFLGGDVRRMTGVRPT